MNLKKNGKQEEFYYKKSYLEHRLQKDVMENGIAYIPCKVEGLSDIISKFSIKGCESLDADFVGYLLDFIDCVPKEYPVVLEIHGPAFSEEEKRLITEVLKSDTDYLLGKTEAQNRYHRKVFWWMVIGTIGSGILLGLIFRYSVNTGGLPPTLLFVLFQQRLLIDKPHDILPSEHRCSPALFLRFLLSCFPASCSAHVPFRSCDLLLPPSLRPFMLPGFIATMRQSDF